MGTNHPGTDEFWYRITYPSIADYMTVRDASIRPHATRLYDRVRLGAAREYAQGVSASSPGLPRSGYPGITVDR